MDTRQNIDVWGWLSPLGFARISRGLLGTVSVVALWAPGLGHAQEAQEGASTSLPEIRVIATSPLSTAPPQLYGLLDGHEYLERYDRLDDRSKFGFATIKLSSVAGGPGSVDIVPPFDIHAEQGGAERSVAVILCSERLVGRHLQNGYDLKTGAVTARLGPEQIPFDIASGQTV